MVHQSQPQSLPQSQHHEQGQGDRLNEKKRERLKHKGADDRAAPQQAVPCYHDMTPVAKTAGGAAAATAAAGPRGDAAQRSACAEASGGTRSQFLRPAEPLPPPPPRDDDAEGAACVGRYFSARAQRSSGGGGTPDTEAAKPQQTPQQTPATRYPSSLLTEPVPMRPLRRTDLYYRPDLDEVSQRVVLESLAQQRAEEEGARTEALRRRELLLATFASQRRDRLTLQVESGLPVPAHKLASFGLQPEPSETRLKKQILTAKARKNAKREELLEAVRVTEAARMEETARQRAASRTRTERRRAERTELEDSVASRCRTRASVAVSERTAGGGEPQGRAGERQADEVAELEAAQQYLDRRSEQLQADEKSRRRARRAPEGEGGGGAASSGTPRCRELPYRLEAPFRHVEAHRAPIVRRGVGCATAVGS